MKSNQGFEFVKWIEFFKADNSKPQTMKTQSATFRKLKPLRRYFSKYDQIP